MNTEKNIVFYDYKLIAPSIIVSGFNMLAYAMFGMTTMNQKLRVVELDRETGAFAYTNYPQINTATRKPKLPKNSTEALQFAQQFIINANTFVVDNAYFQQYQCKELFPVKYLKLENAAPVAHVAKSQIDHWRVSYYIELNYNNIFEKVALLDDYVSFLIGNNGQIIGLDYNILPIDTSVPISVSNKLKSIISHKH